MTDLILKLDAINESNYDFAPFEYMANQAIDFLCKKVDNKINMSITQLWRYWINLYGTLADPRLVTKEWLDDLYDKIMCIVNGNNEMESLYEDYFNAIYYFRNDNIKQNVININNYTVMLNSPLVNKAYAVHNIGEPEVWRNKEWK